MLSPTDPPFAGEVFRYPPTSGRIRKEISDNAMHKTTSGRIRKEISDNVMHKNWRLLIISSAYVGFLGLPIYPTVDFFFGQ
jgi:hypothetical protein